MSTIAIVALIIVLIIVALIMIILLTPITYSFECNGRTPYRAELSVQWLWRVLKLHVAYLQGKPFFKEFYWLGQLKIGPVKDYEQWLEQRVDDEYQRAMDDIEKDPMTAQAKAMMQAMTETGQTGSGPVAGTTIGTAGESLDDVSGQAKAADDDEVISKVTFNADGSVKEKVFTTVKGIKESVKERFQEPEPNDPVASFKSQIPTFWFMKHLTNTELWRQLLIVSKRCYDHSKPRDIAIEGRIGVGDPYKGGILAGMLYSIWPEQAEQIEIDYLQWHLEGSGHIKGRIVLGALAWHGTRFVLSQPMRALIAETIRVLWVKRKEAKQLEKLKAEQAMQS